MRVVSDGCAKDYGYVSYGARGCRHRVRGRGGRRALERNVWAVYYFMTRHVDAARRGNNNSLGRCRGSGGYHGVRKLYDRGQFYMVEVTAASGRGVSVSVNSLSYGFA